MKGKSDSSSKSDKSSSSKSGGDKGGTFTDKDVVALTSATFQHEVLESKDIWLVEFYAPWCGHCQALEPHWNEAATKLKGKVRLGKVDATAEASLAQKYNVKGYPTIKVFNYGLGKSESNA